MMHTWKVINPISESDDNRAVRVMHAASKISTPIVSAVGTFALHNKLHARIETTMADGHKSKKN